MFANLLVPTDGSDCAQTAVGYAEDLATRYDARVHALCVADSRSLETAPQYEELKEERARIAEEVCTELSEGDVSTEVAVRTGVPHEELEILETELVHNHL